MIFSILFPATESRPSPRQQTSLLILLVLLVAILYLPLLDQPQFSNEEPRRALVAQSMIESGDYWVPVVRDEIYTAKPPLYNWLIAAVSLPAGEIERFSTRLISVFCLGLLVVSMVVGFRRHLSTNGLVFLGCALALAPELANKALIAEIDSLFTLLVTLSIWCWFWLDESSHRGIRLWLPSAVLVGLAFLTKREPGLVFYYLAIGGFLLSEHRWKELFHWPHLLSALVTLAMIGLWLWQMIAAIGFDSFVSNTMNEVVMRGTGGSPGDFLVHFILYPTHIFVATIPFSLLLLPLINREIRRELMQRYPRIFKFAAIAVLLNLPLYLLRDGLSVRYFMPMMPTLLVMAALVYDLLVTGTSALAKTWCKLITRLVAGLTLVLAFTINLTLFPELLGLGEKPADMLPTPLVYLLSCGALVSALLLQKPAWQSSKRFLLATLVVMMLVARVLYFDIILPHKSAKLQVTENFAGLAATIHATVPPDAMPVRAYGPTPNPLWYHMGYGNLITAARAEQAGLGPVRYLVCYRRICDELKADGMVTEELSFIPFEDGDVVFARVNPG